MFSRELLPVVITYLFYTLTSSGSANEQFPICICIKSSEQIQHNEFQYQFVSSKCYDAKTYISHALTHRLHPPTGISEVTIRRGTCPENRNRRFFSDSFGGSIDAGAKNDGTSSYGGSVHTPVGSVSGHTHVDSQGHLSGGDASVSGNIGAIGTAGVHGSYDHGHWSAGVDAGVHLGHIADANAHVDVNDHHQVSGGVSGGVDLAGVKATGSVDVDHNGHISQGGQMTIGRREQEVRGRRFFSDSFGGNVDAGAKNDGTSSYGGSVHTPVGSVSGHAHVDSQGHLSRGDASVSGKVGGVGTAGVHGSYDHGHWSEGVDAGVHLGHIADASAHVDVNDHHQVSGGVSGGVDLGGVKATGSVDVDHNGHVSEGGQMTIGRREQEDRNRRFFSDSFGGSVDAGAKNDGTSSYGGGVHTPVGSVSGHAHVDSQGHLSGGDASVSGKVGGVGTAGVHGSYDNGHWSAGVDAGVHLGHIADANAHVDVNDHHQVSGGVSGGVDLGGVKATGSVDVDHNGHVSQGGQMTIGRREQEDRNRRFFSDSFGGSVDAGAKNDGTSSYGGSVHTPVGSVSGHAHVDSHGHFSGGDASVSGKVGGVGTAGVHGSYDHGHWSAGVDAGVHLGHIADASAHVDVNDHHQVSGGVSGGVDLGGVKATGSVDVDHNGHISQGGQMTIGRREQEVRGRRFFSDSFGGNVDAGAKNDGTSSYGGSVHTPVGSVSGHAHVDSQGHLSGGDASVSGKVGGVGTAGVHGSYDHGHWSEGVDAGVHLGHIADASAHVDVNDHYQVSGGVSGGVDLGGVKATGSVDVDHNGHVSEGGQMTIGRREQEDRNRRFFSDSFGGSVDAGAKNDGTSSYGGSVHTPVGSVSGHAHVDSQGHLSGGDASVSGKVGGVGTAGVHGSYDNGHWSAGVDAGVHLGHIADASAHVDVNDHHQVSGGVSGGVDLGGVKATGSVDVDHNGHISQGGQMTIGRREQEVRGRRFFSDSFGGSVDAGAKNDGTSSYGGSVHTPVGSVSGHAHVDSQGHLSGGDASVSGKVGGVGTAGVHGSYDRGHWSAGVDAGVHLGHIADANAHVDVNDHHQVSGGVSGGVDLGGVKATGSVDVDHNGHVSQGGQMTIGRREQEDRNRRFFSDSFGGSVDAGAKNDGTSSYGGSVHTPVGSVSGHAHVDSHGHFSGGDASVSGKVGGVGTAGVHGSYDHGHWSAGVDAGVHLGHIADASAHVDVNDHHQVSGGVSGGVDLGGVKATGSVDVDHNGHISQGGQMTIGRREQEVRGRRFFSDSFGGSVDAGAKNDGTSSYGGSVHTPVGSVSGHAHVDSQGHLSGGDASVSGKVGGVGTAGVHGSYDNGHWSAGVDAGVHLGHIADANAHVDVNDHHQVSGGVSGGVDLGGVKATGSVDVDHNGLVSQGGQMTIGRREQEDRNRRFFSDSFGGSVDAGAKNDGTSSYGGSVHTPVGSVSGHAHVDSHRHFSGGDASVSGKVGGVGTAGVHGSYDHGHWSAGVDAGVHLGHIADASAHVDVNDHHQVSGGVSGGVDLGGVKATGSVDVDHNGHISQGGQMTIGRREQEVRGRRFFSDSFGGNVDAGAKNDGTSSYGGSVHTPVGSVSGHAHVDSQGHLSGGDASVSGKVGGVGTAGVHGSYDHGHWSEGVDAGVHLGHIADASAHVDVNDHYQVSGGVSGGVDLGGVKATGSVDVDHNGHVSEGGQMTIGRREQEDRNRRFFSDSFGGSVDAGAKNDGTSSYGGSVHTPVGSVSGHAHVDSQGHLSGGDASVSGKVGGVGTAGVHGSYDNGHWSAGVDAGVHLGHIADASAHVDVNDHHQVSGGVSGGVDLGGVKATGSVDVDHNGHISQGGQMTIGRREQEVRGRRFFSDSFGGSVDAGAKNDGTSSYGGSVHTPVGSVSGHAHVDSQGHLSGGDASVSGKVGGVGTAGVHGSYDRGHWSAGVDAGVHLGHIADANAHVDVNDHHQVSGGVSGGVDLGGVKATGSVDVDHNGHVSQGGQMTIGRREQEDRNRRFFSDSFGGSVDAGAKNDGTSSYGGSVHTPVGSVSGHAHVDSHGHFSGGDASVSGKVGGVGTAGVHGSYDHGHWSAGVDAGVHLGHIADASAHVDVNDHHQVSGGVSGGVDLGGVKATGSVDVDHNGHISQGGQMTIGRREQEVRGRRFFSDSFGGSVDAGAKNDGTSSYGGSVHTPVGSVSGHAHVDSQGHLSGGDASVSGKVGGVGTAGVHGSYDNGHWSAGVDAGVHLGHIADANAHVDVNDHHQVSGGVSGGVDLGGVKATGSVDVDHNGLVSQGGQMTIGRREQEDRNRRFFSDSFGGSVDAGAKNDGTSSYGGSVHTPVGSVSGHAHVDSHGHFSGGDASVSGKVGGVGTAGVHGSYDHGHWSAGVDAGVHLGHIADASAHVDVNDHHQVSGGVSGGVDLGGVKATGSVDVDHNGHISQGGQMTIGRREQEVRGRRFFSDSFGGSVDAGAKNDGTSSYGGSVHTPVGSVSGHAHVDSQGHLSGGDASVSGKVGGVGTAGVHGSYDHGHWSAGVDAGVHLGHIYQVSGGVSGGVDLGGVKATGSVDVDHNGHVSQGGQMTIGRREQEDRNRRFFSDSFGGSVDAGAKNDGTSSYGGSVHTPVGSVSGHAHVDSHGHFSGGDASVSGKVGGVGTAGVHGSYDHGHWSAGVDAGVHLGHIADASAHVDVNDHHQVSGGVSGGVDLGGVKATGSVDVDHNGHISQGGQMTIGRREQEVRGRRFFSDSFGGNVDAGAKNDGTSSYGGSVHTPVGSVSGHAHVDSQGHLSGGDASVSGKVGGVGTAGVHGSYDHGHWSAGVDAGVHLGHIADANAHVDVNDHNQFSGGVSGGVDLGGVKATGSVDVDHNGHISQGGQMTIGRREQDEIIPF